MITVFGHGMVFVHDQPGYPNVTVNVILSRADFDQVPGEDRKIGIGDDGKEPIWLKQVDKAVEVVTSEPPVDDKVTR